MKIGEFENSEMFGMKDRYLSVKNQEV